MRKVRGYIAFGLITALLLGACGKAPAGNTPTTPPVGTEAPDMTEAPEATKTVEQGEAALPTATMFPKASVEQGDLTYTFKNFEFKQKTGAEYLLHEDGSVEIDFAQRYGEVRFALPECIDMRYCIGITVKLESKYSVDVSFYGEEMLDSSRPKAKFSMDGCYGDGMRDYEGYPKKTEDIYGIGFLSGDRVDDYAEYKAKIYSITFHMVSGGERSVPKEIAPDVTDTMTLLNTYGSLFDEVGTAVSIGELKHPEILETIKKDFNSVTLGVEMKAESLLQGSGKMLSVEEAKQRGYIIPENYSEENVPLLDFSEVDDALEICAENGLKLRAHTLVWQGSTPSWFLRAGYSNSGEYVSPEVMDARMEFYIRTVMEHVYNHPQGSVVNAWDVVNEYFHSTMENSEWLHIYGDMETTPEYVKLAFEIADDVLRKHGIREQVSLIFNDFSTFVIYNGVDTPKSLIELVRYINSDGKICDGIGMQVHIDVSWANPDDIRDAVRKFLAEGLEVQVTEMDIGIVADTEANAKIQMEKYAKILSYLAEIRRDGGNISGITFWGYADSISGADRKPVLFSYPGRPKDAYYKVLQAYVDAGKEEGTPTATPKPTVTKKPAATATPTPKPTKAPIKDGKVTYTFHDLKYLTSYGTEYTVNSDGSMDVKFENQYQEIKLLLPEAIDMSQCEYVTVKAKSEYSDVSVKFFGEEFIDNPYCNELFCCWNCFGEGVIDYEVYQETDAKVYGIGVMALNVAEDYEQYKATIYSVTFHLKQGYATPVPTATAKPTATPAPTATPKPTVTPEPTKAPVTEVAYTYKLRDMKVLRNYAASYEETGDAALKLQFENQYTSVLLMLPEEIDMRYCKKVSIKMRNEYQPVCIDFYDKRALVEEWPTVVHSEYFQCENGVVEYECSPSIDAKLSAISFMSLEEVEDFSKYVTTVYSITFYMEKGHEPEARPTPTPYPKRDTLTKKGDTTYDFNDMEVVSSANVDYKVRKDGSVDLQHSENWSTIRFALPKVVDMSQCTAITVKADSLKPFAVSFYGEEALYSSNGKELFIKYDFDKNKEYEYNVYPETTEKVYGIGIMSMEEIPPGTLYDVSVESITFHMVNDKITIPKKIAPDVTGDMTLLNTYGTKMDYIGCGTVVAELRHPERLRQIKEQCNSITLAYESKLDFLFNYTPSFISVEEAKKQGYLIPDNYREKTVPVFYFDLLDEALTICAENELGFRFHTLLWQESTGTWFFREDYSVDGAYVSPETMDARIEFYIRNVMEHVYNHEAGHVVYAWDVVNEYYHSGLYNSGYAWVYGEQGMEPEYVKLAYQIADEELRKYGIRDKVSLIFNDYCTSDVIGNFDMPQILMDLVSYINADGKICDGIGMQGHLNSTIWLEQFMSAVNRFLDAGLEVQITEFDIQLMGEAEDREARQAELYKGIFRECAKLRSKGANITGITMWDMSDNVSGFRERTPGLFRVPGEPKDVYFAVLQEYVDAGWKEE